MNPHGKETSDGSVDCSLTLVVSGISLAAHSAGAVDTARCSDRRRAGSVLRERGETTDRLRTTTAELSAPQRSTMVTGEQWFARDNRGGPIWGSRDRHQVSPARPKHSTPPDLVGACTQPTFLPPSMTPSGGRSRTSYGPPGRKRCPSVQHGLHIGMQVATVTAGS